MVGIVDSIAGLGVAVGCRDRRLAWECYLRRTEGLTQSVHRRDQEDLNSTEIQSPLFLQWLSQPFTLHCAHVLVTDSYSLLIYQLHSMKPSFRSLSAFSAGAKNSDRLHRNSTEEYFSSLQSWAVREVSRTGWASQEIPRISKLGI